MEAAAETLPSCRRHRRGIHRNRTSRSPAIEIFGCHFAAIHADAVGSGRADRWSFMPEVQRYSDDRNLLSSCEADVIEGDGTPDGFAFRVDRFDLAQVENESNIRRVGDKTNVAVRPDRVFRVEPQEILPETVHHRREGHRRAGMPGIGLLDRIHRKGADRVNAEFVNFFNFHGWYLVEIGKLWYSPEADGPGILLSLEQPVNLSNHRA